MRNRLFPTGPNNQPIPTPMPTLKAIFELSRSFEPTYSSIDSLSTNKGDDVLDEPSDDADAIINDDEDNLICEINLNADNYCLWNAVLGKIDVLLAKKTLTATEAKHLDSKSLIAKQDDVAKTVDLDVSTILFEQIKDPVLGTVRSWLRNGFSPDAKSPDLQQSKGILRYCQEFDRLLIAEEGQLLCYNEPTDKLDDENLQICSPLSLFLECFRPGRYSEMGGHMGASKNYILLLAWHVSLDLCPNC